jgi:hypothetical protein
MVSNQAPVATSVASGVANNVNSAVSDAYTTSASVSLNFGKPAVVKSQRKQLKGGLTLVYDPLSEGMEELSMEERRASLERYQKMLMRSVAK